MRTLLVGYDQLVEGSAFEGDHFVRVQTGYGLRELEGGFCILTWLGQEIKGHDPWDASIPIINGPHPFGPVPSTNSGLGELVVSRPDEPDLVLVTENLQLLPNLGLNILIFGVKPLEFPLI